jgi:hypothetical protein
MSKLYASIDSDARKTEATSRGHKHISTHTRGWDLGVRVRSESDPVSGEPVFEVFVTSGSNGGEADVLVGRVALHHGHRYFYPVDDSIYCGNGYERRVS